MKFTHALTRRPFIFDKRLLRVLAILAITYANPAAAETGNFVGKEAYDRLAESSAEAATFVYGMEAYDQLAKSLINKYRIPGIAIAVAKDGRLVFARGYGFADCDKSKPVKPDTLFRIASLSKPITSFAIMSLVEKGKLNLDNPVFPLLYNTAPSDARINKITVRNLLEHTGGWDRNVSGDPMFNPRQIAKAMGVPLPPDTDTVIRYMLDRQLDFDPGSQYAYSNFGYAVLGKVIEKISKQPYEAYVASLLAPAGIYGMKTGHALLSERQTNEAMYYDEPGKPPVESVYSRAPGKVSRPNGGFALETMEAHGAWLGSAVDLLKFTLAVDGFDTRPDLLTSSSIQSLAEPPSSYNHSNMNWYAKGWMVNSYGNWWHTGNLPGSFSLLVRTHDGYAWAVLGNAYPSAKAPGNDDMEKHDCVALRTPFTKPSNQNWDFMRELKDYMWQASEAVRSWPSHNLFSKELLAK